MVRKLSNTKTDQSRAEQLATTSSFIKLLMIFFYIPINPSAENSSISQSFDSCWSANVFIVEANKGVATMSSSS